MRSSVELARVVRVVAVSPSDVTRERERLRMVVDESNRHLARERDCQLSLWRWETDAYAGLHLDGPQGLIDVAMRIEDADVATSGGTDDREGAVRLARALGCLPLELSHAGAYCAAGTTFDECLELLEACRPRSCSSLTRRRRTRRPSLVRGTSRSMPPSGEAPLARPVLAMAAHLAPDAIPRELFEVLLDLFNRAVDYLIWADAGAHAVDAATRARACAERILGPEHADTLRARRHVAVSHRLVGRMARRSSWVGACLPKPDRILGREHPDTVRARADLAWVPGGTVDNGSAYAPPGA